MDLESKLDAVLDRELADLRKAIESIKKEMRESGFDESFIQSVISGEVEPVRDRPNYDDIH